MNVLPVITRELRAQARQPFTHWLRLSGVVALLGAGMFFALQNAFTPDLGSVLFSYLHLTLFATIWILVPFSAADCLSRERREGTLGLLFLTPLKPADIVIAKGISHGLRAGTLLLAVLPVLTIPFVLGGVSWQQATLSAVINFSSICLALASGLVASALTRSSVRALAGAVMLAVCALIVYACLVGTTVTSAMATRSRIGFSSADFTFLVGFAVVGLNTEVWSGLVTVLKPAQILNGVMQSGVAAILMLAGAVWFAALRIRRSWQEEPPSARVQEMQKVFLQPVIWVGFLHRWMRWKLERNPIGWLEQRRWSGRLVTWAWFAIIISVQSAALTDRNFSRYYDTWQILMAWSLALSMAASAAGSLRRERETGVLELLLVSPLKTGQIIGGRLRGLWGQFLPSIVTLLGVWVYFAGIFEPGESLGLIWFFLVTYLVLPVIGLYFSVRTRHFITSFMLTLGFAIFMPIVMVVVGGFIRWWKNDMIGYPEWQSGFTTQAWIWQCVMAIILGFRLHHRLETRSFPLERGVA